MYCRSHSMLQEAVASIVLRAKAAFKILQRVLLSTANNILTIDTNDYLTLTLVQTRKLTLNWFTSLINFLPFSLNPKCIPRFVPFNSHLMDSVALRFQAIK